MAVIADHCPQIQVTVVDLNAERITTAVEASIASADMVFLSVNTPTKTKGVDGRLRLGTYRTLR